MLVGLSVASAQTDPDAPSASRTGPVAAIAFGDPLPYGLPPIDYAGNGADDVAVRLNADLAAGRKRLAFEETHGWLPSLLAALEVPVASQSLVFSKTALNPKLVTPRNPRAVYFNDDVYVGWVPGAAAIEIATVDPLKGALFYMLRQDRDVPPRLERESRCLACHAGDTTLQVPGHIVRAFVTDAVGNPVSGYSRITHEQTFDKRFGGWYVSGTHGAAGHRGNLVGPADVERQRDEPGFRGNVTDLSTLVDLGRHLAPHSDLVAQLVLHHQVHGQNLIARVGMESRLGRRSDAEARLVRYLLFLDEPPLPAPVRGTTPFAADFARRGPQTRDGRSLRDFDLRTRLFAHRLSYLVHTRAFTGLPDDAQRRVRDGIRATLHDPPTSATPPDAPRPTWPLSEREAILAILRETQAAPP